MTSRHVKDPDGVLSLVDPEIQHTGDNTIRRRLLRARRLGRSVESRTRHVQQHLRRPLIHAVRSAD